MVQQLYSYQLYYQMNQKSLPSHMLMQEKQKQFKRRVQIIQMLKKYSDIKNRTFKIVTELMKLLQEEPFFKPLANNYRVLSQICHKIEYEQFKPNQIIYNTKQEASKFYILLSGTVHLTIPQIIEPSEDKKRQQVYEMSEKQKLHSFLQINTNLIILQTKKNDNKLIIHSNQVKQIQKIIKIVEKGECFGEFMAQDSLRVSKAIAQQQCQVFTMEKSIYESFLKIQVKSQSRSRYTFLSGISLFKDMSTFTIERISLQLSENKMSYGQVLFRQREDINNIYIIKQGQFKLMKQVNKSSQQTVDKKIGLIQYKIQSKPKKEMPFRVIQSGQIIGDSETLSFSQRYRQMCICCTQQALVLSIDKKIFFQILMEDQLNFQKVNKLIKQKNKNKVRSISFFIKKNTHNPLINSILNDQFSSSRRQFEIKRKKLATSCNRLSIQDVYNDQKLVFNEINKTIEKNVNLNRFTINKKKCMTQGISPQTQGKRKVKNIPHCVKDIIELVKQKTVFQKRFRKDRKKQNQIFKFDKTDVPLFIKSRYNKLQNGI